ncbi:MAG: sodium:solute symporter [Chrysiogenales bacterium]|nr:MAG: sodium:solute symporter [Chrysiogenales bacterium]
MMSFDAAIVIIIVYMVGVNLVGLACSKVTSIHDYFLGGRNLPWPVACFSIVATETSSLTFISIPGLAYISNLGFLQVALGYVIGRVLVAAVLLPRYFAGNLETAYEFIQNRFGLLSRRVIAVIFHVTRLLADAIRLFATAIPLSLLLGFDGYWQAIVIIGLTTFIYTLHGGIRSVAIVDTIQLVIYLVSAVAGIIVIADSMGVSVSSMFREIPRESLALFSTGMEKGWHGIFTSYNIFSGLIGCALLSFASHGTDHLIVQRALSCKDLSSARKAMIGSGVLVFFQFALFMILGLCIHLLLKGEVFDKPDAIMPFFIINHVPAIFKGVMLAGIFAAAMSTISSSINSLSSSTAMDILMLSHRDIPEKRKVLLSRLISLVWSCVLIGIAMFVRNTSSPLVELGLTIASITYGGMLALFIQGALFSKFSERAALSGVVVRIASILTISLATPLFWPWYVPVGFIISFCAGAAVHLLEGKRLLGG